MSDPVRYEVVRGVAWLTIDRPEARNALSRAVRDGLFAGVRRFNADDTAQVLVLTGAGDRAFCAGADLKEMADTALTVALTWLTVTLNDTLVWLTPPWAVPPSSTP